MAQPIASAAVGRVNRRFLLLALILAALSAVLVIAALSNAGDGGGSSASGTEVPVVVAKAAIPAGTTITSEMVELVNVSEDLVGEQALASIDIAVGRASRYPIAANQQILLKDIVSGDEILTNDVLANVLEAGRRGLAVSVSAVVNAGGLVLPGDHVDVYWVPEGPSEDVPGAQLIAEDVEVLAVSQTIVEIPATAPGAQTEGEEPANDVNGRVRGIDAEANPDAGTVTLMLTPEEVSRIFCGESGGTLRLAVRAFGDSSSTGQPIADCIIKGQGD